MVVKEKKQKQFKPENAGVTPAVREKFLALGVGHLPVAGRLVIDELQGRFPAVLIAGALNYLSTKTSELLRVESPEGWAYQLREGAEGPKRKRHFHPPASNGQEYIGILLDDTDVVLTVGGGTLRMKPETFKRLRARLHSLD